MTVDISPVAPDDLETLNAITDEVSEAQVFPVQPEAGCATLREGRKTKLANLHDAQKHPALKASVQGVVVGYITWRDDHFVTALYVDLNHQKCGIGGRLMDAMIEQVSSPIIRLRASVNSVGFYQRYGFVAEGDTQTLKGIRFVPMVYHKSEPD